MKVAILAGGLGTRIKEESVNRPKPMIEIGNKPILWHIMKIYAAYGLKDFAILLGYKAEVIKEYFLNWTYYNNSFEIDLKSNKLTLINTSTGEDWKVTLLDTGLDTQTGGRVKKLSKLVGNEDFMVTYGDGVGDINIKKLLEFHKQHGKIATLTAVVPPARFGALALNGDAITKFTEKPTGADGFVNGGFYVFSPKIFDYIDGDNTHLEKEPMNRLSDAGQLVAYKHTGFWKNLDTLRDLELLNGLWNEGKAKWKIW